MDLDKKIKVWKIIGGTSAAAALVSGAFFVHGAYQSIAKDNKPLALDDMLREEGIHSTDEYTASYMEDSRKLYDSLVAGEITTSEFKEAYDRLVSGEHLEDYARKSDDPQIQSIVEDYDKEYHEYQEKEMKEFNDSLVSGCGMVGALALVAGAYNTVNNLKNEKPRKEIHEYLL